MGNILARPEEATATLIKVFDNTFWEMDITHDVVQVNVPDEVNED